MAYILSSRRLSVMQRRMILSIGLWRICIRLSKSKTRTTRIIIEVAYCTLAIYPKNHGLRSYEASLIDTTQNYVYIYIYIYLKISDPSWKDPFTVGTSSFRVLVSQTLYSSRRCINTCVRLDRWETVCNSRDTSILDTNRNQWYFKSIALLVEWRLILHSFGKVPLYARGSPFVSTKKMFFLDPMFSLRSPRS